MSKVDIKRLDSVTKNDTTATEQINDNFKALQAAIENTLSRDGTNPNYMDADLDMNSYRIINSADPVEDNDIVNLKYVEERIGGAVEASKTAVNAAAQAATSAQSALVSSTNAINTLTNAEAQLNSVIKYADDAKQDIDNTIKDALADVKQAALDAAQESIDTAAEQATTIVIDYANNEVKPELMTFVTSAEEDSVMASESAEKSRKWAEGSDTEVTALGGEHSSKTWSGMAKQYATSAESYATQAKNYATSASTSEANAQKYAIRAENALLPNQTGNAGKVLLTDGSAPYWGKSSNHQVVSALPVEPEEDVFYYIPE